MICSSHRLPFQRSLLLRLNIVVQSVMQFSKRSRNRNGGSARTALVSHNEKGTLSESQGSRAHDVAIDIIV